MAVGMMAAPGKTSATEIRESLEYPTMTAVLMVLITYNSDLGDAWEYMDLPCYPVKFSGQAYRMGLNFMVYAMTH